MDEGAVASPQHPRWYTWVAIAAMFVVGWWLWARHAQTVPEVPMQANPSTMPDPLPGISPNITSKMQRVADANIPVVMTSGSTVPYGDKEIKDVVSHALGRLNAMGEHVVPIQIVSSSKTIDSYKTIAYEVTFNAHDFTSNVSMLLSLSALVPVSGQVYVRSLRMSSTSSDANAGPAAGNPEDVEFATYEDPVAALSKVKLA